MTTRSWSSASWYRVSGFRPRLRAHVRIHRHVYRGAVWYVLQDRTSGRFHRFTPDAYRLIMMMDGRRSLDEIWEGALRLLNVDAVTQDELVRLVGRLYSADVLSGDVPPDIVELSDRGRRTKRQKFVKSVMNPLALRLPIFDPDDFLNATMPMVRPFLSWVGVIVYLALLAWGASLAVVNWGPLTDNVLDRALTQENLVLLLVAYPVVKAFHELGHAYVIKRWGGSVHEIGVMFLIFMPVPYVDASDSIAFVSKWRRALVAAAGILVELGLAAIAMMVWLGVEEGLVRAFAFNVLLISGVSTLLFNGNPLLRFDGYYVLCDLIEIPNLGQRANKYLGYLLQRYGFGMRWAENPAEAKHEPAWFVFYALAAYAYRVFIMFAIIGLVATRFFVIGVILAVWALVLMFVWPILKGIWWLFTTPVLRRHRGRAFAVTGSLVGTVLAVLLAWPVPHHTMAQGVVLPSPDSYANATWDGVVGEVYVTPGQQVEAGAALMRIEDPLIAARLEMLQARIVEIDRRLAAEAAVDQIALRIMEEERAAIAADLDLAEARIEGQTVLAGQAGRVILPEGADLEGRYAVRGDLLAVVADFDNPILRVVVPEAQSDFVRNETNALALRFAYAPEKSHSARVLRAAPGLSRTLPSRALTAEGGGTVLLDPARPASELQSFDPVYEMDLALDHATRIPVYGARVHVRFSHDDKPLAGRLWRAGTRIFLKYFVSKEPNV